MNPTSWVLGLAVLLQLDLAPASWAKSRLDAPAANPEVANAAPMDLIRDVALLKAGETWGKGALGEPIPLSDLNGDVVVYMFSYSIGRPHHPSYDEILRGVREGREMVEMLRASRTDEVQERYLAERGPLGAAEAAAGAPDPAASSRPPMNPVRPDGSLSRRAQVKELRRFASERASGAGEFGTVLVAASYDGFPVPAFLHYLAPYYMNFDLALEKAERILGPDAALRRVYFLGLAGQYFEFVGRRGTVLLDCKTLSEESLEELRGAAPHAPPPEETPVSLENRRRVKAELAREWDKVKAQIGANPPRGR